MAYTDINSEDRLVQATFASDESKEVLKPKPRELDFFKERFMSDTEQFSFTLEQQDDFAFLIRFDQDIPPLLTDEPPPLGKDGGPNPTRLLAASVANCLSASLLFALRKFKNNPGPITTVVTAHLERNEARRLRVGYVDVMIQVDAAADTLEHLDRVLAQFEDFCVVTQSVRSGFPVHVSVRDKAGTVLK